MPVPKIIPKVDKSQLLYIRNSPHVGYYRTYLCDVARSEDRYYIRKKDHVSTICYGFTKM